MMFILQKRSLFLTIYLVYKKTQAYIVGAFGICIYNQDDNKTLPVVGAANIRKRTTDSDSVAVF